jgi:hypothetical protein
MIFDLKLINTHDSERVLFDIVSRYPRCFGNILAIMDTGSPRTIISAKDVFLLKIPITSLEASGCIRGFGRGSVPCKLLKNFKFLIKSNDGKIKYLEMPVHVVDISALQKLSQEMQENAFKVPTVIGLDFLRAQNMKLVVDFKNDSSYFEEV